jgi:hypothetical protein
VTHEVCRERKGGTVAHGTPAFQKMLEKKSMKNGKKNHWKSQKKGV